MAWLADSGWVQVVTNVIGLSITLVGVGFGLHKLLAGQMDSRFAEQESRTAEQLERCEEDRRSTTERFIDVCKDYARTNEQHVAALRAIEKSIDGLGREIGRMER